MLPTRTRINGMFTDETEGNCHFRLQALPTDFHSAPDVLMMW